MPKNEQKIVFIIFTLVEVSENNSAKLNEIKMQSV